MNKLVYIAFFGFIPIALGIFALLPAYRATLVVVITGWLFLPTAEVDLPGLPEVTKATIIMASVTAGMFLFDNKTSSAYRFHWLDIPMLLWCLCPFASSMANPPPSGSSSAIYDGISQVLQQVIVYGLPYLVGRIYFGHLRGTRDLAIAVFVGAMIYIPFCLWEIKMSPQLHMQLYGFTPFSFHEVKRLGGYRPVVFMQHGLMLGMWMTTASMIGLWLFMRRSARTIGGFDLFWMLCVLLVTTLFCRSTGALGLFVIGMGVLVLSLWLRTSVLVFALMLSIVLYMGSRATNTWSGRDLIEIAGEVAGDSRANSLRTRIYNENSLAEKALQKPMFGWGSWGGARVYDKYGRDISITDGLWIITLGETGVIGLVMLTTAMLLPVAVWMQRYPPRLWTDPALAAGAVLCVIVVLFMIDSLLNDMKTPVYPMAVGALAGMAALPYARRVPRPQRAGPAAIQPSRAPLS